MEPIQFTTAYNFKEAKAAYWAGYVRTSAFLKSVLVFTVICVIMGITAKIITVVGAFIYFSILALIWYIVMTIRIGTLLKGIRGLHETIKWQITEEEIILIANSYETKIRLNSLLKVNVSNKYIFLWINKILPLAINKKNLTKGQVESVIALIKSKNIIVK